MTRCAAEVTAPQSLEPGCWVSSPAVWPPCQLITVRSPSASVGEFEDVPVVKNKVQSRLFGNAL